MKNGKEAKEIRKAVREHYAQRVEKSCCSSSCCGNDVRLDHIGAANYSPSEQEIVPVDALQHSYGCGNPLAFAGVSAGETVVDIGSGAGLDAILAARSVGPQGHVFGIDMTAEMIERAEENVHRANLHNVTFLLGEAEDIPLEAETADWVISNCVINLSPDKEKVFQEIYRILKPGGRILVSDIVAENLPDQLLADMTAWAGCIAGAIPEADYLQVVRDAGFEALRVVDSVEHSLNVRAAAAREILPAITESLLEEARNIGTRVASIRLYAQKPE